MSQAEVKQLVSKLRFKVGPRRKFCNPKGPEGRLDFMRKIVTALIKHERIELNYTAGDESRQYAERLISDAIRYGECHRSTMEMASYWLIEKQLVHKLFKVLVPRYKDCPYSYTEIWKAPRALPGHGREKCVLELRYNIYPPLAPDTSNNKNMLHNVLLDAAREDYEAEKMALKKTEELESVVSMNELRLEENLDKSGLDADESISHDSEEDESSSDDEASSSSGSNQNIVNNLEEKKKSESHKMKKDS